MKNKLTILLFLMAVSIGGWSQNTIDLPKYDFIRYDSNILRFDTNSAQMKRFFKKFQHVVNEKQGNINIVHIGGSHVQAGTLTNRIRTNILTAYPQKVGDRGLLFPYSAAAKCNNPADYKVHCFEKVELTRCVYKEPQHNMGLCGIAITAKDTTTTLQVLLNEPRFDYHTSQVILFGESPESVIPRFNIQGREVYPSYIDPLTHRYVFNLSSTTDSIDIVLPCQKNQSFTLTGIFMGNKNNGITYHSIGVNGASVPDYLKCSYLTNDIKLLKPDLVVFGIGINDAAGPNFDSAQFRQNYLQLIDSITSVAPNCAFVFITNNDSYKRVKKHTYAVNQNGPKARDVFYRLAEDTHGAVWDQFEIMGGLKSMEKWRINKLAQADKVHFTRAGYELVGDLFTNALFQALDNYMAMNPIADNNKNKKDANKTDERYRYISY